MSSERDPEKATIASVVCVSKYEVVSATDAASRTDESADVKMESIWDNIFMYFDHDEQRTCIIYATYDFVFTIGLIDRGRTRLYGRTPHPRKGSQYC